IKDAKVESRKPESLDDIAQDYFDSATRLGAELKMSKEVEALIKAAKARNYETGARGAVGGPKWFTRVLGPKQTHVYNMSFDVNSVGAIGCEASAPTRCKMVINDYVHFDQVVRIGQYSWKPRPDWPIKTYTIMVHNHHDYPVTYKVFTN